MCAISHRFPAGGRVGGSRSAKARLSYRRNKVLSMTECCKQKQDESSFQPLLSLTAWSSVGLRQLVLQNLTKVL